MRMRIAVVTLQQQKVQDMKTLIKQLFFDREIVEAMKTSKATSEMAYIQLISGRITMKEYVAIDKAAAR
jgi:hypothetical protein